MSISAIDQPGRSHIQRDLKHLVRDVRHEVKAEIKELRAGGEGQTANIESAKIDAVRTAYAEFRDEVQGAFKDAGQGGAFDAAAVPEGLRQAMISFTDKLRALNGPDESPLPTLPVDGPVKDPTDTTLPALGLPPGTLLDTTA